MPCGNGAAFLWAFEFAATTLFIDRLGMGHTTWLSSNNRHSTPISNYTSLGTCNAGYSKA
jgi:hypothetical protein